MANLYAYDPTRGYTVPIGQARVVAYVIDKDTGERYSSRAQAEAAISLVTVDEDVRRGQFATALNNALKTTSGIPVDAEDSRKALQARQLAEVANAPTVTTDTGRVRAGEAVSMGEARPAGTTPVPTAVTTTPSGLNVAEVRAGEAVSMGEARPAGVTPLEVTPTTITVTGPTGPTVTGPTGPAVTGPSGPTITGPTGPTGPTITGPTITGPSGATGPTVTGPTVTGPSGATGPSTSSTTASGPTATGPVTKTVVSTYTDPNTGDVIAVYSDNTTQILSKGTIQSDAAKAAAEKAAAENATKRSAFQLLKDEFNRYGLGMLVPDIENLIKEGVSPSEFTIKLRGTEAYKKRFGANTQRIAKGLRALSEAEYIGLEDQYQNVMRQYGLPSSYYSQQYDPITGVTTQPGFEKFLVGDVSPMELEDRIQTAQNRILYANPEVGIALKTFYPDITNGDLLAYALDPEKGLSQIKRRITAAEIGASAVQLGLATNVTDAEYLARYGVTKDQAQTGYRNVAEVLPRASFLGDVYGKQGMGPYTQATATQEFFNVPGAAEAAAKRRKLTELEQASFSGRSGVGALARERAGGFQAC